jgi:curli production assembly/transport component CsgG
MNFILKTWLPGLILVLLLSGCGAYMNQPLSSSPARLGEETTITDDLRRLPVPREKVVAAVYKFRDQSGQYRPAEIGANWSTAVTQGGTSILIKAMDDSGWFVPIERENVANLLNERKIIRSSRQQYEQSNGGPVLPPLLFAGIILEGGIVSYDANIVTGGAGLRYFGAGASGQYRQDRVTVYLRAISTSNGKVLKTVYTSKTILSQSVDAGLFRFVRFQRLLEAETGFTYNEPSEMAVTEAIEKAVYALIMEGLIDGLWAADPEQQQATNRQVALFKQERAEMQETQLLGRTLYDRESSASITVAASGMIYDGDYPQSRLRPGAEVGHGVALSPRFQAQLNLGTSQLAVASELYKERILYGDLNLITHILPGDRLSPYLLLGAGAILDQTNTLSAGGASQTYLKANTGIGMEFYINDWMALDVSADYHFLFTDELDDISSGRYNDLLWRVRAGVKFFINK